MAEFSGLDVTRAYGLDFLFPARDQAVGASLRTFGEFARPLVDCLGGLLGQGPPGAFIDVGANIGATALPVAARHPDCPVIAVEANRPLATLLAANALGNRLENVSVVHAAVGPQPGLARFPTPALDLAANYGTLSFASSAELPHENVRVCTLDEISPPGAARLVKLDVEGFELQVLKGGQRLFLEERPAWVVEVVQDEASKAVVRTFREAGYRLWWLWSPFTTRAAAKQPNAEREVKGDGNFVALPPGREPPFELPPAGEADTYPLGGAHYPYLKRYGF